MNSDPSSASQETRCQRKTREYLAAILFLPVIFFAFDLAQPNWVKSDENGMEEGLGFNLHWRHATYFVVASLSGAVGGIILTRYPGSEQNEWVAGALGGFVGSFCGLGASVLYLNSVSSTLQFMLLLIANIGGGIPGCLVYFVVKKRFIDTQQDVLGNNLSSELV